MNFKSSCALWALAGALFLSGCGRAAVLDTHDAEHLAEALYTAVTSKRLDLVDSCATKIESLHTAGGLTKAGLDALQVVIEKARAGEWRPAAEELDAIIRAGSPNHSH